MDLVDEEDVAVLKVRQQRRKVARLGDHRTGRGPESDAHLAREDAGERRFAEPWRAMKEDVVECLAAALRCIDEHAQVLAGRLLADELVEALGPKSRVGVFARALGRRYAGRIGSHPLCGFAEGSAYDKRQMCLI